MSAARRQPLQSFMACDAQLVGDRLAQLERLREDLGVAVERAEWELRRVEQRYGQAQREVTDADAALARTVAEGYAQAARIEARGTEAAQALRAAAQAKVELDTALARVASSDALPDVDDSERQPASLEAPLRMSEQWRPPTPVTSGVRGDIPNRGVRWARPEAEAV